MSRLITVVFVLGLVCWPLLGPALAQEAQEAEIEAIKERLAELEAARKKAEGDKGFLSTLDVSGNVTFIGQGTVGNEPGDKTGANVSADLVLTARPTASGTLGFHFDMARGTGIANTPGTAFAVGRFENCFLGGPNADLEWNSDIPHLIEAWYQQSLLNEKVVATFGILDPTVYFDTNEFANDENFQFLADVFVNNSGIHWGGDANGYGPGLRVTLSPLEWLAVSLGGFATQTVSPLGEEEQDEVVGFENEFDQPFGILEVALRLAPLGRPGNYRLYGWYNANEGSFVDVATGRGQADWGVGGSFDQFLAEGFGAFLRWSWERGSVKPVGCPGTLDWHVSGGLSAQGLIPGRPADVAAIGYAVGWISQESRKLPELAGARPTEQWVEAYYSIEAGEHFFFSPDFQYVIHPGGENQHFFIWGFRAQAIF
jgi:hypothetical protein